MPATKTVLIDSPYTPLAKKRLPAGRPRSWYVRHNRKLKAMRLTIALLDSGVYSASEANNKRIRYTADAIGIRPPSDTTCTMVRTLIRKRH
ncbi:hypothetical protein F5X71_32825 [Nocardia brasiliensis]|uniref:Uncharacterized protein n=1 Tax=Nocardia brasiliensis TaxID=37326 RepID=A0A6G9XZV2_NOCBR|nr:hypothetical protein [Nocardia brasiliensis]QIS06451.1 hypothetical protein F5X71_32825 [Nocardia brasiliensis]